MPVGHDEVAKLFNAGVEKLDRHHEQQGADQQGAVEQIGRQGAGEGDCDNQRNGLLPERDFGFDAKATPSSECLAGHERVGGIVVSASGLRAVVS